jgi:transcriptional regulator with XRE-family HTH domain
MKPKAQIQLLDPAVLRHRRLQLGLTESYLGSLCGVSSSVIRRLESGWPQDDLSARFITLLAEELGCTVADLLASPHDGPGSAGDGPQDQVVTLLGAALLGAAEPVPADALCDVLDVDLGELDEAVKQLEILLEPAGGIVVDNGSTLHIVDDMSALDRDQLDRLATATFARRRPNLPELRAILKLIDGEVVRREDLDTVTGRTLARLRNIGVLANAHKPAGVKSDPPTLSDDVRYSLMLDATDPAS